MKGFNKALVICTILNRSIKGNISIMSVISIACSLPSPSESRHRFSAATRGEGRTNRLLIQLLHVMAIMKVWVAREQAPKKRNDEWKNRTINQSLIKGASESRKRHCYDGRPLQLIALHLPFLRCVPLLIREEQQEQEARRTQEKRSRRSRSAIMKGLPPIHHATSSFSSSSSSS